MDRDHHHQQLPQNPKEILLTESPRNDRLKRDEWSEGAVSTLLEAYESKWTLRNRAKLKGQDWEDVAKHVSCKSAKTQTQCKNKIESMKKRYRSESAAADASTWPLYSRLDLLLRGNGPSPPPPPLPPPPPPPSAVTVTPVPVPGMASVDHRLAKEEGDDTREKSIKSKKRARDSYWDIGESIRWVAQVVVRSEETRMETMREIERMRVEAEAKRGEMELKRTEIIANTQLQIAKIFASTHKPT